MLSSTTGVGSSCSTQMSRIATGAKDHNNTECSSVRELTDAEKDLVQEVWGEGRNEGVNGERQLDQPIVKEVLTSTQHPFVKQVSTTFQQMLQQSINHISTSTASFSKCDSMYAAFKAVTQAMQGLDCGGDHSTNPVNSDDHHAVIEAARSCLGSEDEHLCLMRSCNHLGDSKCSSLRVVENGLKTNLALVCPEKLQSEVGLGGCGFWQELTCSKKILAAESACSGNLNLKTCVEGILGIGSDCISCICKIIGC